MADPGTYEVISGCRSCGNADLALVLDLGDLPLSDGLWRPGDDRNDEARYPLTLVRCTACSLVQILETVEPRTLYPEDYPYFSSYSDALVEHSRLHVEDIVDTKELDGESLVIELASNDGYLLQWFVKEGIPVLGIDPADGPAAVAERRGIPTICDFFTPSLAEELVAQGRHADVVLGNNDLAHVPDQNAFVQGIATVLKPDGIVEMEFPYVMDLIDHLEFDTIYHEHHCYFSVGSVIPLFERHGLRLVSVRHLPIHGGSLRVTFAKQGDPDPSVAEFLRREEDKGLHGAPYYSDFAKGVLGIKRDLNALIDDLRSSGASIAAYGAAAKGAIMVNYCGISSDRVEYVVDRNDNKQGLEMPGVPIPIHSPEMLEERPPDYLLVLAWNFIDEIARQQSAYAEAGGKFIVPVPSPRIL
jgi:SAM-dependent methyltransferase